MYKRQVLALYARYSGELRRALDYEIDGLVVSVASIHAQTQLGEVHRRPRGAVAFKFASPAKVTRVVRIAWDTGPSGRVTPVAFVEPVELASATVQRASLHNVANVRALGIGAGDEVLVSRRNDVIPYVEEVVTKLGPIEEPPTVCPVCGEGLFVEGEYLLCRNATCPALVEGRQNATHLMVDLRDLCSIERAHGIFLFGVEPYFSAPHPHRLGRSRFEPGSSSAERAEQVLAAERFVTGFTRAAIRPVRI